MESLGTVNGLSIGVIGEDRFDGVILTVPGSDGINYNFGERPLPGGIVQSGQTASIGFWQNRNGQQLIRSLNGGSSSSHLATWLAATFPNLYGDQAGSNNLSGKTNSEVADLYVSLFKRTAKTSPGGPPKLDAQVLATAMSVYVTSYQLAGLTAQQYGFVVTESGDSATPSSTLAAPAPPWEPRTTRK